jgi:hypothetical protein
VEGPRREEPWNVRSEQLPAVPPLADQRRIEFGAGDMRQRNLDATAQREWILLLIG